jgi:hypothetical protein
VKLGKLRWEKNSAVYRLDKPIIALYVDEKDEEICFSTKPDDVKKC